MSTTLQHTRPEDCPCGSGRYLDCCGRFISGGEVPQTALDLMRSRYTAYVLRDERYLQLTWHGSTRPASRLLASSDSIKWLSLEIRASEETGSAATVEFVARYKEQGRAQRLHETSRFVREEGQWLYLDGSFTHSKK